MPREDQSTEETTLEVEPQEEVVVEQPQEMVQKRYKGQTIEMPAWMADVWDEREKEFQDRLSSPTRREAQLERQQREQANRQAQGQPQQSPQDEDLEFYSQGPARSLKQLREEVKREIREERTQQENLARLQQEWWGRFWNENQDLRDHQYGGAAVRLIVQEHNQELGQLDEADCHDRMAQYARGFLGMAQQKRTLSNRQVVDERAGTAPRRQSRQEDKPAQYSTVAAINEMKERKNRARYNLKKD